MRSILTAFVLIAIPALAGAQENPYAALLDRHKVRQDEEGIREYLGQLHPGGDQQVLIQTLINQLRDENFSRREIAMQQLIEMPVLPMAALRQAASGADVESRWRAREILRRAGSESSALLHAVLKTVDVKKVPGLAEEVLATIPLCTEEYMQRAAVDALAATTADRPGDVPALKQALRHPQGAVRSAAAAALLNHSSEEHAQAVAELLADPDDAVRLAAAQALAASSLAGDAPRAWLATLGALLRSEEIRVRAGAIQTLRAVTAQEFPFAPYDVSAERAKMASAWDEWIDGPGQTAELRVFRPRNFELGRVLVCYYGQNRIDELDAQRLETAGAALPNWSKTVQNPWACQGLPNGHRLIASYSGKYVVEYDADGQEVWRKDDLPGSPFSVERLDDGNTLLACSDAQRVVEIDREGREVWSYVTAGRPMDARRLENGRTLVTLQQLNRVVEVDQELKITWQIDDVSNPLSSQRLENGHTLICETGANRVVEYDADKRPVWSRENLINPYDAQRLANGHTIISDNRGVREVDVTGDRIIWEILGQSVSRISRY